jgi:hypothetical protein
MIDGAKMLNIIKIMYTKSIILRSVLNVNTSGSTGSQAHQQSDQPV